MKLEIWEAALDIISAGGKIDPYGNFLVKNKKGQLHRKDGPAQLWRCGDLFWFYKDDIHRADGPAVIRHDGEQKWYWQGLLHRNDGPAIIRPDGSKEWWKYGSCITKRKA